MSLFYNAALTNCFLFAFENDSNIDGIGGFSEEDKQSICKFMSVAINLAVSSHKPVSIFLLPFIYIMLIMKFWTTDQALSY